MGKKKARRMTELAPVAIGEASSIGDESGQEQPQPQTPRKRGRPRKMVEKKTEGEDGEEKEGVEELGASSVDAAEGSLEKPLEKNKSREEEERREFSQVDSSAQEEKQEPSRSRKARRKSKPRKSS